MRFLVDRGINVVVIDVTSLIFPYGEIEQSDFPGLDKITVRHVSSNREARKLLPILRATDLIIYLAGGNGLSRQNLVVTRTVSRSKTPVMLLKPPTNPGWEHNKFINREGRQFIGLLRLFFRKDILNSIIARVPPKWLSIREAEYLLDCCPGIDRRNSLAGPMTRRIKAHAFDYDLYLEEKIKQPQELNQAVFLDQYMPFHHDQKETKLVFQLDPIKYYDELDAFFKKVEANIGLKVVIAAHPRADYTKHPEILTRWPIIYGETAKLIVESRLVLAQTSTAIGMAVMARKPLMLLTSNDMERLGMERFVFRSLSASLGVTLTPVDKDNEVDWNAVYKVNETLYDSYLNTYVKASDSPDKPLWQIALEGINSTGSRQGPEQTKSK